MIHNKREKINRNEEGNDTDDNIRRQRHLKVIVAILNLRRPKLNFYKYKLECQKWEFTEQNKKQIRGTPGGSVS